MIEVRYLTKYFGARAAIRELNFDIRPGEVVGFVGLNGAGKTTTLKILGCVLLPSSGQVRVDGIEVDGRAARGAPQDRFPARRAASLRRDDGGAYLAFAAGCAASPDATPRRACKKARTSSPCATYMVKSSAPCRTDFASGWAWHRRWFTALAC